MNTNTQDIDELLAYATVYCQRGGLPDSPLSRNELDELYELMEERWESDDLDSLHQK